MDLKTTALSKEQQFARLKELRKLAQSMPQKASFIILGDKGAGKTSILTTGRRPIRMYHFDPNGLNSQAAQRGIKEGWLLATTYWHEECENPQAYSAFEKDWMTDLTSGMLNMFGTVVIDSATLFISAVANEVAIREGRKKGQLAIQDYKVIYGIVRDILHITQADSSADFMISGHLELDKDDVTGKMIASFATFKQLKTIVPALFTEQYVMIQKGKGERVALTCAQGRYNAGTQIGGYGIFQSEEKPDIKYLLKKAKWDDSDNKDGMKALGLLKS